MIEYFSKMIKCVNVRKNILKNCESEVEQSNQEFPENNITMCREGNDKTTS